MRARSAIAAAVPLLGLLACGTAPGKPAGAEPAAADQQITARVTADIWPAVNAYNGAPTQNSPGTTALLAVIDPALRADGAGAAYGALRSAAAALGRQGDYDPATRLSYGNDGMIAARTEVTAADDSAATATVCYTYTQWSYVNFADRTFSPAAGQVTLDLVSVNGIWYLHAITGDRAVAGCGQPN